MNTTTTTQTTTLAEQINDLCDAIHGSSLDDKIKAILTKELRSARFRFNEANDEAKAAVFYMSQGTENAAKFVAASNDFEHAAQAARRAADKMREAEVKFEYALDMWDALTAE